MSCCLLKAYIAHGLFCLPLYGHLLGRFFLIGAMSTVGILVAFTIKTMSFVSFFSFALCVLNRYTFYDGPPFATGLPHYGHILAGTIKDIVTRFAHQNGFHVDRRFGWDCHGLPVVRRNCIAFLKAGSDTNRTQHSQNVHFSLLVVNLCIYFYVDCSML